MEITELEYSQLQAKLAEQARELEELRGADNDTQVREFLQGRRQREANNVARCEAVKQSFK